MRIDPHPTLPSCYTTPDLIDVMSPEAPAQANGCSDEDDARRAFVYGLLLGRFVHTQQRDENQS